MKTCQCTSAVPCESCIEQILTELFSSHRKARQEAEDVIFTPSEYVDLLQRINSDLAALDREQQDAPTQQVPQTTGIPVTDKCACLYNPLDPSRVIRCEQHAQPGRRAKADDSRYCCWCWTQQHPGVPYPYWSSHMCQTCFNRELAKRRAQVVAQVVREAPQALCAEGTGAIA